MKFTYWSPVRWGFSWSAQIPRLLWDKVMATETATAKVTTSMTMKTNSPNTIISITMMKPPEGGIPKMKGISPGLAKKDQLPPGLEKQLVRRGSLPPGLQKRIQPCPEDLERRLPPSPPGCVNVLIGGHVVLLNHKTNIVVDIFHFEVN